MKIFKLPDLGEGLPDAEIHEWHVKEGETVKTDQVLVSMETAKAVVDVPAPFDGVIAKLYGQQGDTIDTGEPLIGFESEEEETPAAAPKKAKAKAAGQSAATVAGNIEVGETVLQESAMGVTPASTQSSGITTLPVIRILANRLNMDLSSIQPTGSAGNITLDDFANAIKQRMGGPVSTAPAIKKTTVSGDVEPLRGVRKSMAQAMSQSHAEVVSVTIMDEADIHAWPKGTDITGRIIRAIIHACKVEPALNAYFDGERMGRQLHQQVNLGLALDSEDGLFVPVIKNADSLKPEALRDTINRFKTEVKDRSISPKELLGATITLSNFGMFAGRFANPVIVPPMVAIIGAGRLREIFVPVDGKPEIHRVMPLSVSFDHRAATGGEATRFLRAMIDDLQSKD